MIDPSYANLEGAVICSWTVAVADQALFFASQTLCGDGEQTRMEELRLRCFENLVDGIVTFRASLDRQGARLTGTCDVVDEHDEVLASVDAVIAVVDG